MNGQIEYIRIPIQILQDSNLCDKQKMLLGLIISFSEKGLMMSNGELAKLLAFKCVSYVSDLIKDLEGKGLVKITGKQSRYRKIYFRGNSIVDANQLSNKTEALSDINGVLSEKSELTFGNSRNKTKGTKKNIKELKTYRPNSEEFELACLLFNLILQRKPDFKEPNLQQWSRHIGLMIRSDNRNPENIKAVIEWCQSDEGDGKKWKGWQNNILSTAALREKFDRLEIAMNYHKEKNKPFKLITEEEYNEMLKGYEQNGR